MLRACQVWYLAHLLDLLVIKEVRQRIGAGFFLLLLPSFLQF